MEERWNRVHIRKRMKELAWHLCHSELKEGGPLMKELKASLILRFCDLNWGNYSNDILANPGKPVSRQGEIMNKVHFG